MLNNSSIKLGKSNIKINYFLIFLPEGKALTTISLNMHAGCLLEFILYKYQ